MKTEKDYIKISRRGHVMRLQEAGLNIREAIRLINQISKERLIVITNELNQPKIMHNNNNTELQREKLNREYLERLEAKFKPAVLISKTVYPDREHSFNEIAEHIYNTNREDLKRN